MIKTVGYNSHIGSEAKTTEVGSRLTWSDHQSVEIDRIEQNGSIHFGILCEFNPNRLKNAHLTDLDARRKVHCSPLFLLPSRRVE